MVKQYPELERGESASQTGREHIPPRIFKEMTQLTKQKEQLDALLVGINPFNGKSRAAEISKMLAISQRAAYNLCNSTTEFRVLRAGGSIRIPKDSFDAWLYRAA